MKSSRKINLTDKIKWLTFVAAIILILILPTIVPNIFIVNVKSLPEQAEWTVLIYMIADNNLHDCAQKDIKEMEEVGSTDKINILLYLDLPNENTVIYKVEKGGRSIIKDYHINLNSGDQSSLRNFIEIAKAYPAKKWVLVLYDHGGSISGFGSDESEGGDGLKLPELSKALREGGIHFDVIFFDACIMGTIEVMCELKDYCNYIVASQEIMASFSDGGSSVPYNDILDYLSKNPEVSAEEIAKKIVEKYDHFLRAIEYIRFLKGPTLSVIDVSKIDSLVSSTDDLGNFLLNNWHLYKNEINKAYDKSEKFEGAGIDIYDFCNKLEELIKNDELHEITKEIKNKISEIVKKHYKWTFFSLGHENSYGLSIYLERQLSLYLFANCRFKELAPHWIDFLKVFSTSIEFWIHSQQLEHSFYLQGEEAVLNFVIANFKEEDADVWLGVSIKDKNDEWIKYQESIDLPPSPIHFKPGQSRLIEAKFKIPKDALLGPYTFTVNCYKDNTYTERYIDNLDGWVYAFEVLSASGKINILFPTEEQPTEAGSPSNPHNIYIAVSSIPSILNTINFNVYIGGKKADVISKESRDFGFLLKIMPPKQENEGIYDLKIDAIFNSPKDGSPMIWSGEAKNSVKYTLVPTIIQKGLNWLRENQQQDGSWDSSVGITSLATLAFLNAGYDESDPTVKKAINYILSNIKEDGSIWNSSPTYETSLSLLALIATHNKDYTNIINAAKEWLIKSQWDEDCLWGSVKIEDWRYGGFGYGRGERPDLSNTQFALMALDAAGLPKDHSLWSKAQVFLARCQKINFIVYVDIEGKEYAINPYNVQGEIDGGFVYYPGASLAGDQKSYGSMTGAGIWGLLLSGVSREDPRVKAAVEWLRQHYTWDGNPGMPDPNFALYYYYMTMSKALLMLGSEVLGELSKCWYRDLYDKFEQLARKPSEDKWYWVNPEGSVQEDKPSLVTSYALLSLETQFPTIKEKLSYLTFILKCPVHLTLYSPTRRIVGLDYSTGSARVDLPNAMYYKDTYFQSIVIVEPEAGEYKLNMIGVDTGFYNFSILRTIGNETTLISSFEGTIRAGELLETSLVVTSIVGPLTVYTSTPTHSILDLHPSQLNVKILEGQKREVNITVCGSSETKDLVNTVLSSTRLVSDSGKIFDLTHITFNENNITVLAGSCKNVTITIFAPYGSEGKYKGFLRAVCGSYEDITIIELTVLHRVRGDINGDGIVDYKDLAIICSCYNSKIGDANFITDADLNNDEIINYKDLAILISNYGKNG